MNKILSLLLFCFIIPLPLLAQVRPAEGSTLNYRIAGFSFPLSDKQTEYKIEIANGNYSSEDSFKKNIIKVAAGNANRIIVEVPSFGHQYTWRIAYMRNKSVSAYSAFHHFATGSIPEVDTSKVRLRLIKPAVKYQDHFVFVDGNKALYNMNGDPVWYLPANYGKNNKNYLVRDLKLTPQGTLTYLHNEQAFEIDYDGDTLWTMPKKVGENGEDSEHLHHELTRLANGHYMVLGTENIAWEAAPQNNGNSKNATRYKAQFGTIIEYDERGNIVWEWKSLNYFLNSDLINYQSVAKANGLDLHENSFFFDEKNNNIYVSFKNISRIIKIKYPSGEVINAYGPAYRPGMPEGKNDLFCEQHAVKRSMKGYLYLYNNNACNDDGALPKVIMMEEPATTGSNALKKVWEYECTIDDVNLNPLFKRAREKIIKQGKNNQADRTDRNSTSRITNGGNVIELPDQSLFVCMNSQYCKVFIVGQDKNILWSASPEKWNPVKKEWFVTPQQYKASIISPAELERFIWHEAVKNYK